MKITALIFGAISLFTLSSVTAFAESPSGKSLYQAALYQDLPQLKELIAKGADVNYRENGRPVLGWAAQNGNPTVVEELLKAGADPNAADDNLGQTPLMRAIDTQQLEIVKLLLGAKADPNVKSKEGKSTLVFAIESQKPEFVKLLVDAHVEVKEKTADGETPVLAAALTGMSEGIEMIRLLGKAGAELNVSNAAYTPLAYAISQENKEMVSALLEVGADPNAKTQSGGVPLDSALDNPEILSLLLKSKADPNEVNEMGDTPLMVAIENRNVDAARALLEAGADPKKPDSNGRTSADLAESMFQDEISELIKKKLGEHEPAKKPELATIPVDKGSPDCTIVDAAKQQMELHGELQKQVDAGKMSSEIFRTFADDTKDYGRMLTENPPEACALFARLRKKYGL